MRVVSLAILSSCDFSCLEDIHKPQIKIAINNSFQYYSLLYYGNLLFVFMYRCAKGNMVKVRFEFSIIIKFCTFIWPLSENRLSYTGEICSV